MENCFTTQVRSRFEASDYIEAEIRGAERALEAAFESPDQTASRVVIRVRRTGVDK